MESHSHSQALVQRAQDGDEDALVQLLESCRPQLTRFVEFHRRTSAIEVDEILQETSLRAVESLERFCWRGDGSFLHWLEGIAKNVIHQQARRHQRRKALSLVDDFPDRDRASPSKSLRRDERFERLEAALDRLSEDHRKVILLARIDKVPIAEIARRMGRSPGAVSHLLLRAVEKLRGAFGDTESLHLPDRRLEDRKGGSRGH